MELCTNVRENKAQVFLHRVEKLQSDSGLNNFAKYHHISCQLSKLEIYKDT